ncbi:helix-turn-helix transcriptional regulator [Nocardia harenae]|uniref:helix-turn-helix transcriptional regulator n=1 Tax=Nocardia harenae TaxID=358707 RepID=UPI000830F9E1|nr:LuxR C-terminal-related transcriptional regulator [Nocardia harenae]
MVRSLHALGQPPVAVPGTDRYGPEPLPPDLVVQALDTFRAVRRRVAMAELHNLRDEDGIALAIGRAWEAISASLCHETGDTRDLLDALLLLRRLEALVSAHRRNAVIALHERVGEALMRLSRCAGADELISAIPREVVRLGYDRALFSLVTGGTWRPRAIHSRQDSGWADGYLHGHREIALALPAAAVGKRTAHVDETTMLGRSERDTGFELWRRSKSKTFWMVPIVHDFRLVGMIHADCRFRERPATRTEVDALEYFCRQLPLALDRRATGAAAHSAGHPEFDAAPPNRAERLPRPAVEAGEAEGQLSLREIDVVRLMAEGLTNAQIGRRLTITEGTVKSHVKRILRKTGAANRAEAVAVWIHDRRLTAV